MATLMAIYLFICLTTGSCVFLTKKKFGICIVPSMITLTLGLYISQMLFRSFVPGVVLAYISAMAFPILLFKKQFRNELRTNFFSSGFFVFTIIYVLMLIMDYGFKFRAWDELSHWGMMVKEMFRIGRFYTEEISHLYVHKEYPPFMALWELLLCKVLMQYSELAVGAAVHSLNFALIFSVVTENINGKNNAGRNFKERVMNILSTILFCFITMYLVLTLDVDGMFTTIYTDIAIAMFLVHAFSLVIFEEAYDGIFGVTSLGVSLVALVLTKQIGIVLSLIILFFFFTKPLVANKSFYSLKMTIFALFAVVIIPLLFWVSWNKYTKGVAPAGQFDLGKLDFNEVWAVVTGGGQENSQVIRDVYIDKILHEKLSGLRFNLTYPRLLLCLWVGSLGLSFISKGRLKIKEAFVLGITYTCACIGYAFTLFVLYLFCFPNERPAVCYTRYMSSLAIPLVISLWFYLYKVLIQIRENKIRIIGMFAIAVTLMLLCDNSCLNRIKPAMFKEDKLIHYREVAKIIKDNSEVESKIFIVANSNADYQYYVGYYDNEHIMDFRAAQDIVNMDYTDENARLYVLDAIREDDYVYINELSEGFVLTFSDLLKQGEFEIGALYKVVNLEDKCYLEKVS